MSAALRFFSASYGEARKKFLDACRQAGAAVESMQNTHANGPFGEPLYTDVGRIGPEDAAGLLVLVSGTHGNEGFCGSAVQTGLLREDLHERLPDGVGVLMVHAINPYGFAHVRRVTEGNVDLNRNFRDHATAPRDNPAYESVHGFLCPSDLMAGKSRYDAERDAFIDAHGATAYQAAVTGGQYAHADGLFYGGTAPVWSNITFRDVLARHAKGLTAAALIDFHTGLGPYGHGEAIGQGGGETRALAQSWFGDVCYTEDGSSVSAPITGNVLGVFQATVDARHAAGIALEFGTRDVMYVLEALRADNWLYLHGEVESEEGRAIKAHIMDALYPEEDPWKEQVWDQGRAMVERVLAKLGA